MKNWCCLKRKWVGGIANVEQSISYWKLNAVRRDISCTLFQTWRDGKIERWMLLSDAFIFLTSFYTWTYLQDFYFFQFLCSCFLFLYPFRHLLSLVFQGQALRMDFTCLFCVCGCALSCLFTLKLGFCVFDETEWRQRCSGHVYSTTVFCLELFCQYSSIATFLPITRSGFEVRVR